MASEVSSLRPKYLEQEETMSQEFNSFLSTLPKEKGWLETHLYQYQGFWYPAKYLDGILSCQKHFSPQDFDIFLVTMPKSGTTWLTALMFALINRNRYPPFHKSHPLLNSNPHELVPFLEVQLYVRDQIPDLASFQSPRLFSTHMPYGSLPQLVRDRCKIVYLCRNPKDNFVSLWHFTNKLRLPEMGTNSITEFFDLFCNGISWWGPFWDHVLGYWKQSKENSNRILFLKFEDMKAYPGKVLRILAEFLDCPFSAEEEALGMAEKILELCSFERLTRLEVNKTGKFPSGEENNVFFHRGKTGDWINYLSDEMTVKIDRITEHKFAESGLVL